MENSIPTPKRKPPEAFSLSPNAVNEKIKKFIRLHEDEVAYFYRDTKGNVTVGIGQMIPNEDKVKELPLWSLIWEGILMSRNGRAFSTLYAVEIGTQRRVNPAVIFIEEISKQMKMI